MDTSEIVVPVTLDKRWLAALEEMDNNNGISAEKRKSGK